MTFNILAKDRNGNIKLCAKMIVDRDTFIFESESIDLKMALEGYVKDGILCKGPRGFFERVTVEDDLFLQKLINRLNKTFGYIVERA